MATITRGIHDQVTNADLGDVEILQRELVFVTGTVNTSGDNTIVAAPVSGSVKIAALQIQNESAVSTTVIVKFEADTVWRVLLHTQGDRLVLPLSQGHTWDVGEGNDLILNLSGANAIGYNVAYYV